MSRVDLVQRFLDHPCYFDNGAGSLATRWKESKEDIIIARKKARLILAEEELDELEEVEKEFKRVFFDIETSYNVIGDFSCGYNKTVGPHQILKERAVICICWKWENEDKVHFLKWDENQCDKKMLTEFVSVIEEADEVIGHNGDRFDIPWLRTRCASVSIKTSLQCIRW
jgi:DNA polymerase elongation subunit (family B)